MKNEKLREKLVEILNQASEITVLAEPDEPGVLDKLFAVFREFAALLEGSECEKLSGYSKDLARFLDKAAEGDEDGPVAFKVCIDAIVAFQGIIRDGRTIEEVAFPVELGSADVRQGNAGSRSGEPVDEPQVETPVVETPDEDSRKTSDGSGAQGKNKERSNNLDMTTAGDVLDEAAQTGGGLTLEERAGKYLTFRLGEEEYGLEILKVQEIIKMMEITRVPRTPEFVRGVINLRGKVIPVVDLRTKFGLPPVDATEKTCVIVVQVVRETGHVTMGIIVDEVSEVLDISAECMEPTPEFGTSVDTAFILGMGKLDKKVVMLLDVDRVLSSGELAALSAC